MKISNKLPVGIQYFANIRESNYIYIDKTAYIYHLCSRKGIPYFLSRPRRFGKSLLLDAMAELFSGNKSLFSEKKGLLNILPPSVIHNQKVRNKNNFNKKQ